MFCSHMSYTSEIFCTTETAYLEHVDGTVIDFPERLTLLDLLQDLTASRSVDDDEAIGVDGSQADVRRRAVVLTHIMQCIGERHFWVPGEYACRGVRMM